MHVQIKEPGDWAKYKWEFNKDTKSFGPDRKTGIAMPNKVRDDMIKTDEGKQALKDAFRAIGEKLEW